MPGLFQMDPPFVFALLVGAGVVVVALSTLMLFPPHCLPLLK